MTLAKTLQITVAIVATVALGLLVMGFNQQAQAQTQQSGITAHLSFGEILQLLALITGNEAPTLGGQSTTNSGLIINEDGSDDDTRIESDSNTHMLFVDAGNDRIGVNNSSPSFTVDVTGTGAFSGNFGAASSSPTTDLSVGTGGSTTTIMGGNLCMAFQDEAGTMTWITINVGSSDDNVFATSTSACNT